MNIWQITVGEPSPAESDSVRLLRTGILAKELTRRGHNVTWWSSTYDHFTKKFLANKDENITWDGGTLSLVHTKTFYKKNVSLQRIQHNIEVASNFNEEVHKRPLPDLILCSYPTIELAEQAVIFGRENNIPVIVDIRDLWPDVYLNAIPNFLHFLAKPLLFKYYKKAHWILKNCSHLVAVSEGYLNWGLKLAGRNKTKFDSVFPIGYVKESSSENSKKDLQFLTNLNISDEKIVVWFVGSFGRSYDLSTVVKAARKLQEVQDGDFHFVISGDGEARESLEKLAQGLSNVSFTGWIDSDKINALKQRVNIGLMAYAKNAKQGLPNKIFEYMSSGIPILCCLTGESADLIERHSLGENYLPENPEDLVFKLGKLKSVELRSHISKNSIDTYTSSFEADKIYTSFSAYLENLPR